MGYRMLPVCLLGVGVVSAAHGQVPSVIGRWAPVDEPRNNPLTVWQFTAQGTVTTTLLALPGAGGTYRFDGRRLTETFFDGSTVTSEVLFIGDTMVQRSSRGDTRLTRATPGFQDTLPLHGTWASAGTGLWIVYRPDGNFSMQAVSTGSYSWNGDTLTVAVRTSPVRTLRYRWTVQGRDTLLLPLDVKPNFHPPTLRPLP